MATPTKRRRAPKARSRTTRRARPASRQRGADIDNLIAVAERDGNADLLRVARAFKAAEENGHPAEMAEAFLDLCDMFLPKPAPRRLRVPR